MENNVDVLQEPKMNPWGHNFKVQNKIDYRIL